MNDNKKRKFRELISITTDIYNNLRTYAIVTMLGWCRTLIALLLGVELVSVQAPYNKNLLVAAIPKSI